ncbi:MAG: hypothetical protein AB7G13_10370 [Lautropia sp.]
MLGADLGDRSACGERQGQACLGRREPEEHPQSVGIERRRRRFGPERHQHFPRLASEARRQRCHQDEQARASGGAENHRPAAAADRGFTDQRREPSGLGRIDRAEPVPRRSQRDPAVRFQRAGRRIREPDPARSIADDAAEGERLQCRKPDIRLQAWTEPPAQLQRALQMRHQRFQAADIPPTEVVSTRAAMHADLGRRAGADRKLRHPHHMDGVDDAREVRVELRSAELPNGKQIAVAHDPGPVPREDERDDRMHATVVRHVSLQRLVRQAASHCLDRLVRVQNRDHGTAAAAGLHHGSREPLQSRRVERRFVEIVDVGRPMREARVHALPPVVNGAFVCLRCPCELKASAHLGPTPRNIHGIPRRVTNSNDAPDEAIS